MSFKDFSRQLVEEILRTYLRLSIINPIINSIFGGTPGYTARHEMSGGDIANRFVDIGKKAVGMKAGGGTVQQGQPTMVGERGIKFAIIKYLQTHPGFITLDSMLTKLIMGSRLLMRRKKTLYTGLQLENATLGRATLIQAIIDNLIPIERPIVVANDQVRLGRPPDSVLEIFD